MGVGIVEILLSNAGATAGMKAVAGAAPFGVRDARLRFCDAPKRILKILINRVKSDFSQTLYTAVYLVVLLPSQIKLFR